MSELGKFEGVEVEVSAPLALEAQTREAQVVDARVAFGRLIVRSVKRALDIALAGALLLVLLPVIVALAILVRLDSRGPVFYRCDRVGLRGRPFRMLKFRKMVSDAHGLPLTLASDDRFTRIGRFLARYKFDELPQLWNVLVGQMSIVGPRPETSEFVERYPGEFYGAILRVRPGIVGLSQIAFADESAVLDVADPVGHYVRRILPQKIALDAMYARELSIGRDMAIFFWALVTVLLRKPVAVHRETAAMNLRRRKHGSGAEPRPATDELPSPGQRPAAGENVG
jgi:lipopolysaccharide/colanic/teichoic acid biosynthesis glycosyltransferase